MSAVVPLPICSAAHFAELLEGDAPLIDLRAPIEFAAGRFPAAVNLPLLLDDERHAVGLRYRGRGQAAAVELGHSLVSGAVRSARMQAWRAFAQAHPQALLYCWRGGMRSQLVQQWLHADGCTLARIDGGYKALRQFAIAALETHSTRLGPFYVLGGRTGSGKTQLLRRFAASIDLEGLANHRGSSFGRRAAEQPTQIDFEHALLRALLQRQRAAPITGSDTGLLVEDESRTIGRVATPPSLYARLRESPLVVIDVPREERAAHIEREYVHEELARLQAEQPNAPLERLEASLTAALARIERRLGGALHREIAGKLADAFRLHARGDSGGHRAWIGALLEHYYDRMYDYQLGRNQARIRMRGGRAEVLAWLSERLAEQLAEQLPELPADQPSDASDASAAR